VAPSDVAQGRLVADWVKEAGHSTVAVLYVNNSWGVGLKETFCKAFTQSGGRVLLVESCEEGARDMRAQLAKIRDASPPCLFMPTYPKEGGIAVKQAKELKLDVPIFGADTWSSKEFAEAAGASAEGCLFTMPGQYQGESYRKFAAKFDKKYGQQPDVNASSAYDTIHLVAIAMKRAETLNGEGIRKALCTIRDFTGASGANLAFDTRGDVVGLSFERKVILDGKVQPFAEGK
jgi:branched-chain amino acid transport system substrate-binding protein